MATRIPLVLSFASALALTLACSATDTDVEDDFDVDGAASVGGGAGEAGGGGESGSAATGGSAGSSGDSGTAGFAGTAGSSAGGAAGSLGSGGASGSGGGSGGSGGTAPTGPDPKHTVEMVYSTVNIGRTYGTKSDVQAVIDKVGDVIGGKTGPKFIGWQEIGEADPCGDTCEIDSIHARFPSANDWTTDRPQSVKVPITSKGSNDHAARAEFASPGWAGVSPTRFVTVVRYKDRGLSVLNTHFIAGAWSCKSNVAQRKEYWQQAWKVLKAEVEKEHDLGRNVIVTGDLNRPRSANNCNPAWEPTSLHPQSQIIGGENIDYIYAVPAAGNKFVVSTKNGNKLRGSISLGIDSHQGHWVIGRFLPK